MSHESATADTVAHAMAETAQAVGAATPARRRGRALLRLASRALVPLVILGSGALVYQASNAAFTATTATGTNSWATGNVFLSNAMVSGAAFNVTNIKPGVANAQTRCIDVTYTGSLDSN